MPEETDELAQLRKRKLMQLKSQQDQMVEAEEQNRAMEQQKATILRQILTPEARERLGRVKAARPELAAQVEQQLIMLASSGRLAQKIDDITMKQVLAKMMPKKKEITITRKRASKND